MSVLNVLVMGGTRFNGRACVIELYKAGHNVTVFNRGKSADDLPRGVERLHGDRHDADDLERALAHREFDCVVDVSAYRLTDDVQPLIELMNGRIGHYLFISSTGLYTSPSALPIREGVHVDRDAQTHYGWNKLDIEQYLFRAYQSGGVPATTVAISMVFGPHNNILDREQRMFDRFLSGRPILIPHDGNTLGQVGHVEDQARAIRMMLNNPITFGKRYNVTGNDCFTDNIYVDTFERVLGVAVERHSVPPAIMDEVWASDRWQASALVQRLGTAYRWNEHLLFSIDRIRADLGWEPEFTFESAVAQTYAWYVDSGRATQASFDWSFEDALLKRIGA